MNTAIPMQQMMRRSFRVFDSVHFSRPVTRGKSAVVTEESAAHWQARAGRLGLGGDVCFFFRPFAG